MTEQHNIHKSHRERIRDKAELGFLPFADHELFEMLLFYSIPRGDTNELGHLLIERFGSFNAVLEASADELQQVKGIGLNSALHIKLIAEMIRRYVGGVVENTPRYDRLSKIAEYIWPRFHGLGNERMYMMLFNNKMSMLDCVCVADGSVNSASVSPGKMIRTALEKNASAVVLAHNHPHGLTHASQDDKDLTVSMVDRFRLVDVNLVEHLIIAENCFKPVLKSECIIPGSERICNRNFLVSQGVSMDDFYDIDEKTYHFEALFDAVENNLS